MLPTTLYDKKEPRHHSKSQARQQQQASGDIAGNESPLSTGGNASSMSATTRLAPDATFVLDGPYEATVNEPLSVPLVLVVPTSQLRIGGEGELTVAIELRSGTSGVVGGGSSSGGGPSTSNSGGGGNNQTTAASASSASANTTSSSSLNVPSTTTTGGGKNNNNNDDGGDDEPLHHLNGETETDTPTAVINHDFRNDYEKKPPIERESAYFVFDDFIITKPGFYRLGASLVDYYSSAEIQSSWVACPHAIRVCPKLAPMTITTAGAGAGGSGNTQQHSQHSQQHSQMHQALPPSPASATGKTTTTPTTPVGGGARVGGGGPAGPGGMGSSPASATEEYVAADETEWPSLASSAPGATGGGPVGSTSAAAMAIAAANNARRPAVEGMDEYRWKVNARKGGLKHLCMTKTLKAAGVLKDKDL